jgi:hypothetical protein
MARQIDGDGTPTSRQGGQVELPGQAVAGKAMQKQHGHAAAAHRKISGRAAGDGGDTGAQTASFRNRAGRNGAG